jgi:hypothetical protein
LAELRARASLKEFLAGDVPGVTTPGRAGDLEKGALFFDPGTVLKTGTTLVRQWRGHNHAVLVHQDGFEYERQRHRSLTVIAERITGAPWSGPRLWRDQASARLAARRGRPMTRPATNGTDGTEPSDVRSTPASRPRRGSNSSSIRCRRSARPARPSSTANGTRAGYACPGAAADARKGGEAVLSRVSWAS